MAIVRRRDAMKRLGARMCPRCHRAFKGKLYRLHDLESNQSHEGCSDCHEEQRRRNQEYDRRRWENELGTRLKNWEEETRQPYSAASAREYREAYGEYADDIEVALSSWQIGNGIVGPRR